jgi:Zn ribbon nucleic-acid-binding protein
MTIERHTWISDHETWFEFAKQLFKDGKIHHHVVCPRCNKKWTLVYRRGDSVRMVDQECDLCGKQFRTLCQKIDKEQSQ